MQAVSEARISGHKQVPAPTGTYADSSMNKLGVFGVYVQLPKQPLRLFWYTCREGFHSVSISYKVREFFYVHRPDAGTDIANFIYLVECHLGVADKSTFNFTDKNNIMWVMPSSWWTSDPMRYQFYSICLRAALNWRRDENQDWRNVLNRHKYVSPTRAAADRFLRGYTKYTGKVVGWCKQFETHYNPAHIKQLLTLPDDERHRRISDAAYFKWEQAGCPVGRDHEFWEEARREID